MWEARSGGESMGPLAGFCGLRRTDLMPEPELLFGLGRAFWGKGLAGEAATAVLHFAFSQLVLPAIGAAADVPNVRSIRLLERLGMRVVRRAEVQGRPTLLYRLTVADCAALTYPQQRRDT